MLQSSSSEKKLLKIAFLGPICTKKGHYGPHPKWKIIFFGKNNNSRSSAPRNLFYQNIICFGWVVMNFFLSWVMFFVKKVSFPVLKQLCITLLHLSITYFIWCAWVHYTMRQLCVSHKKTRCTKLRGAQHSPPELLRRAQADFQLLCTSKPNFSSPEFPCTGLGFF